MLAIVTCDSAVPLFLRQILNPRALIVVGKVDRLGPCIRSSEKRTGPASREQRLEPVVSGRAIRLDRVYIGLESKLDVEWTTGGAGSRRSCVDVDESHLIDCARANITD